MDKYDELLTAKSWIIMNFTTGAYMRGSNVQAKRQIASLTKMYTLYACLQINKELNINPQKTYVKVIDLLNAGTTADLVPEKFILLKDLYYGLMLPSGNDAAALLAFYYGNWLYKQVIFPNSIYTKVRKVDLKEMMKYCNLLTKRFMQYTNDKIIKGQLNHQKTKLENPHGLSNKFQVSTAWQLAEAAIHFMKNSKDFRQIVKIQKHTGSYLEDETTNSSSNSMFEWQNTNILLKQEGFEGVKTGQTVTAGCCLCSYKSVLIKKKFEYEFMVVVLGCESAQKRFSQTKILCEDLQKHLQQVLY